MGLSHLSMINAHPDVDVVAICDSTGYLLEVLKKYTGKQIFSDYQQMLAKVELDAVIIATPSKYHGKMVKDALDKGLHVFCEKPFCLDPEESLALAQLADSKGLTNQVGYHYRFVGAFEEVKRLLDQEAIGKVTHVLAEAYGPVVLKPKGSTWRSNRSEGGGCLYDYAAHPINLINWYFGMPSQVSGTVLNSIFSQGIEDEVYSTMLYDDGPSVQVSVNWSDESQRKMSTKLTFWGTNGRIYADRQECQVYLRDTKAPPPGYTEGWNVRYTTDLTEEVWFYLRGEEYSAQLDNFVKAIGGGPVRQANSFAGAADTDRVLAMMIADADGSGGSSLQPVAGQPAKRSFFRRRA